jgi:hypothetical protein
MCNGFWFLSILGSFFHSFNIILHSLSFFFNLSFYMCDSKKINGVKWKNKVVFVLWKNTTDFGWRLCHIFFFMFCLEFLDAKENI